jgi:chromosome segregation ATPase
MEKVNRCGYFTGKTTPPGCKKMITDYDQRIAELEQQATLDMNRIKQLRIRQLELEQQLSQAHDTVFSQDEELNRLTDKVAELEQQLELMQKVRPSQQEIDAMEQQVAELQAERDRLRDELEHHWGSSDCSCERWEDSYE